MAVEIAKRTYNFDIKKLLGDYTPGSPSCPKLLFWANYLHDLESLWWIIVKTLFTFEETEALGSDSSAYQLQAKNRDEVVEMLFSGDGEGKTCMRAAFFYDSEYSGYSYFDDYLKTIPCPLSALETIIREIRTKLHNAYKIKEYDMERLDRPIELSAGDTLHEEILKVLKSHPIENVDIIAIDDKPKADAERKEKTKRAKCDSSEDERPAKRAR